MKIENDVSGRPGSVHRLRAQTMGSRWIWVDWCRPKRRGDPAPRSISYRKADQAESSGITG